MFVPLNVCPTQCLSWSMFSPHGICPNQLVSLSICLTKYFFNLNFGQLNICFTWCLSHLSFVPINDCPIHCLSHSMFVPSNVCPTQCLIHLSHCIFVQFDFGPTNISLAWCSTWCLSNSIFVLRWHPKGRGQKKNLEFSRFGQTHPPTPKNRQNLEKK